MKRLTERVKFVRAATTDDDSGGYIAGDYVKLYECWANVEQNRNSREYQNLQMANMVAVDITMRYAHDFVPSINMNAQWRDKLLTLHGSPDLSNKNYITIPAFYDPAETI